jgi:hypothetical protein
MQLISTVCYFWNIYGSGHLDQLRPLLKGYIDKRLSHETFLHDDLTRPQSHKQSNRVLLSRIVRLSDDLVRASEEKVNIALAVNNSVMNFHFLSIDIVDCIEGGATYAFAGSRYSRSTVISRRSPGYKHAIHPSP